MSLLDYRKMFLLNAIIAWLYGVALVLFPTEMGEAYGNFPYTIELEVTGRALGSAFIAFGLSTLVLSEVTEPNVLRNASIAFIIAHLVFALITLYAVFVNVGNMFFWSGLIINPIFALGFAYLLATKAYES